MDEEQLNRMLTELQKQTAILGKIGDALGVARNRSNSNSGSGSGSAADGAQLATVRRNQAAQNTATQTATRSMSMFGKAMDGAADGLTVLAKATVNTGGHMLAAGRKITDGSKKIVGSMSMSADSMMSSLTHTLEHGVDGWVGLLGGVAIANLIKGADSLYGSYQSLAKFGQTFNGSMLEMGAQAGAAGLPLREFAHLLERNSTTAAVMADHGDKVGTSMGGLYSQVSDNLRQFGMFGMTLDQVSDITSDYAETVRRQDAGALRNRDSMTRSVTQFAKDIADFSTVTGRNREDIARATKGALTDVTYAARDLTEAQRNAVTRATTFLAALPGEAGDSLSRMLTATVGTGAAYLTEQGQQFAKVGASGLNAVVQGLADKAQSGQITEHDFMSAKEQFDAYYDMNKDTLSRQAMMGNHSAQETLKMLQQMRGIDAKRFEEMQKQGELTRTWGNIQSVWYKLTGAFQQSFFKALAPIEDAFGKFGSEEMLNHFKGVFEKLGTVVGTLITKVLTPANIQMFSGWIERFGQWVNDGLGGIMNATGGVQNWLEGLWADFKKTKIGEELVGLGSAISNIAGTIRSAYEMLNKFTGGRADTVIGAGIVMVIANKLTGGLLGGVVSRVLGGAMRGGGLMGRMLGKIPFVGNLLSRVPGASMVGSLLGSTVGEMSVNAGVVNVNGGIGGVPGVPAIGGMSGLATAAVAAVAVAGGVATHQALAQNDPDDRIGAWMDRNVFGAARIDNFFGRFLGIGRTYEEQAAAQRRIDEKDRATAAPKDASDSKPSPAVQTPAPNQRNPDSGTVAGTPGAAGTSALVSPATPNDPSQLPPVMPTMDDLSPGERMRAKQEAAAAGVAGAAAASNAQAMDLNTANSPVDVQNKLLSDIRDLLQQTLALSGQAARQQIEQQRKTTNALQVGVAWGGT